jgi:hypothetical protein
MKKLTATVEPEFEAGVWLVTVTDDDTKEVQTLTITVGSEKYAAFKAMEQVNGD